MRSSEEPKKVNKLKAPNRQNKEEAQMWKRRKKKEKDYEIERNENVNTLNILV